MMKVFIPIVLMLALSLFCSAGMRDGLIFYVPFEENSDAVTANGNKMCMSGEFALEKGIAGNGAAVKDKSPALNYSNVGNYDITHGTVAFWVKPAWNGTDKADKPRNFFSGGHIKLSLQGTRTFLMTGGGAPGKDDFAWDYSLYWDGCSNWKAGQWQHVALVWDRAAGTKALYVNGKKEAESRCERFPASIGAAEPLLFGENTPGVYDEIMVWNRVLIPSEIKQLAENSAAIAAELGGTGNPSPVIDAGKTAAALVQGCSFYAAFDGSTQPVKGEVSGNADSQAAVRYGQGVVNQSFSGTAVYDWRQAADAQAGAIAFWIKPAVKFSELKEAVTILSSGHLVLQFVPGNRKLFFMNGGVADGNFAWDYAGWTEEPMKWDASEWHHLAVTWNQAANRKNIYVDGKLIQSSNITRFPDKLDGATKFGTQNAEYDELMVWNRELNASEVAGLCAFPAAAAQELGVKVKDSLTRAAAVTGARRILKDAATAEPLSFEIVPCTPAKTIVAPGETFNAEFTVCNRSLRDFSGEVTFILRDFQLNNCNESQRMMTLSGGQHQRLTLPFQVRQRGSYKVEASWNIDGKKKVCDVSAFACWNKLRPSAPDSFFGNHINSWSGGAFLEQAAKLGQNWERNHNMLQATWWESVQPEKGPFNWTQSDIYINQMKDHGIQVLGQFFTTPYWAAAGGAREKSSGYSACWKPDAQAFDRYVFETVSHYRGYIKYWEVWNEPDVPMFWKGTPADFGILAQAAVRAAHRADPAAKVCVGGFGGSAWAWLQKAAEAGALKEADIFTFHMYNSPVITAEEMYKTVAARMKRYRDLLEQYGKGGNTPVWNSEGNGASSTFFQGMHFPQMPPEKLLTPTWREAAISTVQFHAVQMALGVGKYFLYLQNAPSLNAPDVYSNLSSLDLNNAPKPYLVARAAMQEQLDYTEFKELIRLPDKRFWALIFQAKDKTESVVMLWCGEGGEMRLRCEWPATPVESVDLFGNTSQCDPAVIKVSAMPSYLRVKSDAAPVIKAIHNARLDVDKAPALLEVAASTANAKPRIPDLPDFSWPSENPAGIFMIDMRKYCNMGLADEVVGDGKGGWSDEGELNDMRDLKTGIRKFYGVPFDLIKPSDNHDKAVISLKGGSARMLPEKVAGIMVGRKAGVLYFLHTATWGSSAGKIGEYVVHYKDGTREKIIIENPVNIHDWWFDYNEKELSRPVPVRVTNTLDGEPAWRYLRVFEWYNPKGKIPIESIDAVSYGHANLIVLAITGI